LAGVAAGFAGAFSSALTAGAGAGVALLVSAGLPAFASFSALVFGFSTLGISLGVAGTGAVAAAGFLTSSVLAGVALAKADVVANATINVAIRFFILSFLLVNEL
jgi:hypothetical protein